MQVAAGVAMGLPAALVMGGILRANLVATDARDPATLSSAVALLVLVAAGACLVQVRRATRLNPNVALRVDEWTVLVSRSAFSDGASRVPALLIAHVCPLRSLFAPWPAGAALRKPLQN